MKVTRLGYKVNRFRILSAAVLICSIHPIFAIDGPLDVDSARLSLQRDYALMIGQQIREVVCAASEEDVKSFAQNLLNEGNDPFIQGEIDYIPKQRFSFTMNGSVEDSLKWTTTAYHYCPKTAQWEFDPNSTITTANNPFGLPDVGMVMTTNYCMLPTDNSHERELCCFWFECVMPPFDGNEVPPYCDAFDSKKLCSDSGEPQETRDKNKGEDLDKCFLEGEVNPDIIHQPNLDLDLKSCPFPLYSSQHGELKIPRVALSRSIKEEGMDIFQATLCRSNNNEPPRFALCEAAYLGIKEEYQDNDTTFDDSTKIVSVFHVIDSDARAYTLELKAIDFGAGKLEFEWNEEKDSLTARERAQYNYVLLTVRKIRKAIDSVIKNSEAERVITGFLEKLSFNDPFVKEIQFELLTAEEEFAIIRITMQDTEFVDSRLQGEKYAYRYYEGTICRYEEYECPQNGEKDCKCIGGISTSAIGASSLLEHIGKVLNTEHCQNDNPSSWCPGWLELVNK